VKARRSQAGPLDRPVIAAAQSGRIEVPAGVAEDDDVAVTGPVAALAESGEGLCNVA
jgi:hypothetical protein